MKYYLKLSLLFIVSTLYSQAPPADDQNWVLNSSKSDEFSNSVLDQTKWDNCADLGIVWGYDSDIKGDNVILDAGYLRLRWSKEGSNMFVGQIRSKNSDYSYGYFEISAKMLDPGNYKNGIPCATGMTPCFWAYSIETVLYPCCHDEIDIVEKLYKTCEDVNIMGGGVWDKVPESTDPNASCTAVKTFPMEYNYSQPLFEDEHIYGAEWLPDRVILYFDKQPVGIYYGSGIPQHSQYVVLSQATNNKYADFDETITSPQDFKINYFRYYTLIDDYCEYDASILNNTQLNNFVFGVRRNITFGNGSSTISLTLGNNLTFRATNDITINGDFTVPLGAELSLIPTPCY